MKQKSITLEASLKVSDDALKALRESTTNDKSSHSADREELLMESTKLSTTVTNLKNELYEVKSNFDDLQHKHKRTENIGLYFVFFFCRGHEQQTAEWTN